MKQFGLIGYPLKNSFSENYFTTKFKELGLHDHLYQNFPIEHIDRFKSLLETHPELKGLNVTIPYKESVIPFLNELDISALNVGAVNCINITNGKLIGYNTDVYGFELSLLPLLAYKNIQYALILGTGGAAKAVAVVLNKLGIHYQFVSRNRTAKNIDYEDLTEDIFTKNKLLVNCTPLGMFPNTEGAPDIPYQWITPDHICYDLIYLPAETQFLTRSQNQGATIKNGLEMLHLQAGKSWKIWTNEP